jgi:hypothetical protein
MLVDQRSEAVRVELRKLLVALMVLSTITFSLGSILERSSADAHAPETGTQEPGHQGGEGSGTDEGEGSGESVASDGSQETQADESLFGIDPESTPLLIVALVVSLLLAAGCWLRPGWRWLVVLTAVVMASFAVLDLREVVHQFDESNLGLGVIALAVMLLHLAAAITAGVLLARGSDGDARLAAA